MQKYKSGKSVFFVHPLFGFEPIFWIIELNTPLTLILSMMASAVLLVVLLMRTRRRRQLVAFLCLAARIRFLVGSFGQ